MPLSCPIFKLFLELLQFVLVFVQLNKGKEITLTEVFELLVLASPNAHLLKWHDIFIYNLIIIVLILLKVDGNFTFLAISAPYPLLVIVATIGAD